MEELGSMWSYQETVDELKQKLIYTTLELESVRMEANEEIRNNKENLKSLFYLLKMACQERDEARDQLQKLMNKVMLSTPTDIPSKANSSITKSNSLYETHIHQSHGSSSVDSLFNTVSSNLSVSSIAEIDPASAVIDKFVKGKTLPQKGKLLQAVMEAGPLLQTLLLAGPLPRWRNPPPLQPFKIPSVSSSSYEVAKINQKPAPKPSYTDQKPLNSMSYPNISRVSSLMCSASTLNFTSSPSGSCFKESLLWAGKRQRFQ